MTPYIRILWVALIALLPAAGCSSQGSDLPEMSSKPDVSAYHLGPGDRLTHSVRCRLPPNAGGSLRTALTFTDGQGIIWRRAEDGRLVEQIEGRNIVVQE